MSKKPIIPENIDTLIVDLILDYYNIEEINGHRKALTSEKFDEIIIKAEKIYYKHLLIQKQHGVA